MYLPLLRFKFVQYCIILSFLCHNNRPSHPLLQSEFWNPSLLHGHLILPLFELRLRSFFRRNGCLEDGVLIWDMRQLFFLLFQPCNVYMYVAGNRRFLYFLYILMKYVVLSPNNLKRIFNSLVEHRRNPVKRFLININKLSSAILRLSYFHRNER